jgi:hypothetical protein
MEPCLKLSLLGAAVLLLVVQVDSQPAEAQGFLNKLNRAARGIGALPNLPRGERRGQRRSSGGGDDGGSSSSSSGDSSGGQSKTMADTLRDANNAAAAEAEWREQMRAVALERGRNVDKAVSDFIGRLKDYHYTLLRRDVSASTGLNINQVTEGELKRSVEVAYKGARLYEFEQFSGELWTRDRLTVRIIDEAQKGLAPYFTGVGARGPGMKEIDELFARSANKVYSSALEVAEVVGVSLSFDRFIRAMYEYSDHADERLWAPGADGRYEKLATNLIDQVPREKFIQDGTGLASDPLGMQRQFLYRFRARRALYDCLSAKYPDLVQKSGGRLIEASYDDGNKTSGKSASDGTTVVANKGIGVEASASAAPEPSVNGPTETGAVVVMELDNIVWGKANAFLDQYCRTSVLTIAGDAVTGNIHPVSSRSDTSLPSGEDPTKPVPTALPESGR